MRDPLRPSDFKCDYPACHMLSFAEVYTGKAGERFWCYLCLFHFIQERLRGADFCWTLAWWILRLPFIHYVWNIMVK